MSTLNWKLAAEIAGGVLFVALLAWFFIFRDTPDLEPTETAPQQTFVQGDVSVDATAEQGNATQAPEEAVESPVSRTKIFKMSNGPVAGATFMQELRPTTTVARFAMQQNGHVLSLPIDSPGTVARAVSNTTIPGASRAVWALSEDSGRQAATGVFMQYTDDSVIKTVSLAFPISTGSSGAAPVRIQFLPDNIIDLAVSPDGTSAAYLVRTPSGADGYIARADGTNPRRAFSLPLSQITLAWPSGGTIIAYTKPAAGITGMAFSINTESGLALPILYAQGLSVTGGTDSRILVYQTTGDGGRISYMHDTRTNLDRPLSFSPVPEKCAWSRLRPSAMYCAVPLAYSSPDYLDLWHQGAISAADSLISYDLSTGQADIIAIPGSADGGEASDILELAVAPEDKYLLFVRKGDRSLWGVRLY